MEEDLPLTAGLSGVNRLALPSFVLGYHGCDEEVAERILSGEEELQASRNDYDWLGSGIYFWEHNPARAEDWAGEMCGRGRIGSPAVIGAVLDLANCFNLLDASCIRLLSDAHRTLKAASAEAGRALPANISPGKRAPALVRRLDCAVVNLAMELNPGFDTVRAVFVEGAPIYPGAGFHEKSHIQICVRNPARIVGTFRVRSDPRRVPPTRTARSKRR